MFGLTAPYLIGGAALALVLAGGTAYHLGMTSSLRSQIEDLQMMLKTSSDDLQTCRDNNTVLTSSVGRQNAAVEALRSQGQGIMTAIELADRRAAQRNGATQDRVADILRTVPRAGETECQAAFRVLTEPTP